MITGAGAQTFSCDRSFDQEVIADQAKVFTPSQVTPIFSLIGDIARKNVDVRVRTIGAVPASIGNLEKAVVDPTVGMLRACRSWQGIAPQNQPNALTFKSNIAVLVLSIDTQGRGGATAYFGAGVDVDNQGVSKSLRDSIRLNKIEPLMTSQANLGNAVVAGLTEFNNQLRAPVVPPKAQTAPKPLQVTVATVAPSSAKTTDAPQPTGVSLGWYLVGALLVALLCGGIGLWFYKRQEERKEAQRLAINAKLLADSRMVEVETGNLSASLRKQLENLKDQIPERVFADLSDKINIVESKISAASSASSSLNQGSDPNDGRLSIGDYKAIAQSYEMQVTSILQSAIDQTTRIIERLARLANNPNAESGLTRLRPPAPVPAPEAEPTYKPEVVTPLPPIDINTRAYSRLSKDTQRAIQEADWAIGRAERYILSYSPWVDLPARRMLWSARRLRDSAFTEHFASDRFETARNACGVAQDALAQARRDVSLGRDYSSAYWYSHWVWNPWYAENYGIVPYSHHTHHYHESDAVYGGYGSQIAGPVYINQDQQAASDSANLDERGNAGQRVAFTDQAPASDPADLDDRGNSGRRVEFVQEPSRVVEEPASSGWNEPVKEPDPPAYDPPSSSSSSDSSSGWSSSDSGSSSSDSGSSSSDSGGSSDGGSSD